MRLIHLDTDPWELGKNYPAEVAILGDPKSTLPELTAAVEAAMTGGARGAARERFKAACEATLAERNALKAKAKALAGKSPVQALALLDAIGDMLPKDAVVIEEVLSSAPGIRSLIRSDDPQSYFGLRGGGIGWGLPAAIGIKLALPHRPVVALVGDGSAMYTIQALWTAAHDRIAVVFVILNNTLLPHPQAAAAGAARPCRAGRHLRRHGARRSADRLRRPRALARRRGRARQDRARCDRPRSQRASSPTRRS